MLSHFRDFVNDCCLLLLSEAWNFSLSCCDKQCFISIESNLYSIHNRWLGDTESSKGTGYFGLWKSCRLLQDGQDLLCEGRLDDFSSIPTPAFRAATIFIGLSVVLIFLCLCSFLLFFFLHSSTVFHICGWLQAFNGEYDMIQWLDKIIHTCWCHNILTLCPQSVMQLPSLSVTRDGEVKRFLHFVRLLDCD